MLQLLSVVILGKTMGEMEWNEETFYVTLYK